MSKVGPIMCVSSTNERKTQIGWATTLQQKTWKWISVNDTPSKRSPCYVPNSNEMTIKSLCLKAFAKYNVNEYA